jgi:acyl carrier protein
MIRFSIKLDYIDLYFKEFMKIEKAKSIVISTINNVVNGKIKITEKSSLIGGDSNIDSMKLVEICLALEDVADENGFEFNWTSETTMSKSRSMFRNIESLAKEFAKQSEV